MLAVLLLLSFFWFGIGLTLEDAIRLGLENNQEVQAQRYQLKRYLYELKAERNLYLPKFSLNFSYNTLSDKQYMNVPIFGSIPATKRDFKNFEASLTEVLFDGGLRGARVSIAESGVKVGQYLLAEKKQDVALRIAQAYLDVLSMEEVLQAYRKQEQAIQEQLLRTEAFFKQGLVAITDVLQARVRLSEVKRDLRDAQGKLDVAKANLASLLYVPEENLGKVEPLKVSPQDVSLEQAIQTALAERPIIKAYAESVYQARQQAKAQLSLLLPSVILQGKYTYSDQNPIVSPKGFYSLALGVSLQWQGFESYYRRLALLEEEKKALSELEDIKQKVTLEVKSAYQEYLTARDNFRVAEDSLRYAEEYYRLSLEQYKNQIISSTDLLLAEASLTKARVDKTVSYYNYLKAYYKLLRSMGVFP